MEFTDWAGWRRSGVVTDTDGPLFEAEYVTTSGRSRTGWFDLLRLTAPSTRPGPNEHTAD